MQIQRCICAAAAVIFCTAAAAADPELLLARTVSKLKQAQISGGRSMHAVSLNPAAFSVAPNSTLMLTIPGRPVYPIVFERSVTHDSGNVSWIGYLKDYGNDFRIIVTSGPNGVSGHINTPDGTFTLTRAGDGGEWLLDVRASGLKAPEVTASDIVVPPRGARRQANEAQSAAAGLAAPLASGAANSVVDLMVLYTPGMVTRYGNGYQARLDQLVAFSNQNYVDSGIAITLRLVHSEMVNYSDSTSLSVALDTLASSENPGAGFPTDAALANVKNLRNQYGADLVMLHRPYNTASAGAGGFCGLGFLNGNDGQPFAGDAGFGYSAVSDGEDTGGGSLFCDDTTFVHEMGHNMGAAHDRVQVQKDWNGQGAFPQGAYAYSYGYGVSGKFYTVMAYDNYNAPRIGKFSNPAFTCLGVPCGVSESNAVSSANNALTLNNTAALVAAFRQTAIAGTGTVNFSSASFSAAENGGSAIVTVTRTDNAAGAAAASVSYRTSDGSATSSRYTAQTGTLTWGAGDTATKTITVPVIDNSVADGNATFVVTLSNASGTALGNIISATVTIVDNEKLPFVRAVVGGDSHSFGVRNDGVVYAWGLNSSGQLGDGSTTKRSTPVQISSLANIVGVGAGTSHGIAVANDASVWVWGDNSIGQLGNATYSSGSVTPAMMSNVVAKAVAAGRYFSYALKSDGTVYAWGDNSNGQLGDGTTNPRNSAVKVANLTGVTAVAAGHDHGLAILADGTVRTWGRGDSGNLGDGGVVDRSTPVAVSGLTGVTAVAGGAFHSMALKSDGTVWSWGFNGFGELGDGTHVQRNTPVQVTVLSGVIAIAAGNQSSYALKNDGTMWAWGRNSNGELGNVGTAAASLPTLVTGLTSVAGIAAGNYDALAVKSDGTVRAWGLNASSELGDGTVISRSSPVSVPGVGGSGALNLNGSAITPQSGYWWNPAEPGRWFNIEKKGSNLFMATFLYDVSGRTTWYGVGPGAMNGNTYTGTIDSYSGGQTLTGAYKSPTVLGPSGSFSITFTSSTQGSITWPGGTVPIQRYDFGPGGAAGTQAAGTPETGWWWAPTEGGRGYAIEVQGGTMFLAGYMYDAAGNAVWYASGPTAMNGTTAYIGVWQQYGNGQTLTGAYKAPGIVNANLGSVTIQFTSTTTGTLTFPDGRNVAIIRYVF